MEEKEGHVFVVGIGGVSNGGKTTLAKSLESCLKKDGFHVMVIHQDVYFKEEEDVPLHDSGEFGRWDEMIAFDMDKMVTEVTRHIEELKKLGKPCILIIEGILIFNHRDLNTLFNKRYVFTLTKEVARNRRLTRNYEPPDTPNIFNYHVWPMYVKYLNKLRETVTALTELNGEVMQEKTLERVRSDVTEILRSMQNAS